MARKRTYSSARASNSKRVRAGTSGRRYSKSGRAGGVRSNRASRSQTVRIEIVQPGSNPLARPDLIGLGLVKNSPPRKPL